MDMWVKNILLAHSEAQLRKAMNNEVLKWDVKTVVKIQDEPKHDDKNIDELHDKADDE